VVAVRFASITCSVASTTPRYAAVSDGDGNGVYNAEDMSSPSIRGAWLTAGLSVSF